MSKGPSLKRASFCKGIAGFVAMIDYSSDGKYIRVSTGAYKNQYFDVPGGKELTDKTAIRSLSFDSWTSVLGSEVVGIWPRNSDKADVNCANVSHGGNAIATGDDF